MKRRVRKKNRDLTLLLIPHHEAGITRLKIKPWMAGVIVATCLSMVITAGYFVYDYLDLLAKAERLDQLTEINLFQAKEISRLDDTTGQLEKKLEEIDTLEKNVRELLGLESNTGDRSELPSRGGQRIERMAANQLGQEPGYQNLSLERREDLTDIGLRLSTISEQVDQNISNLELLETQVEARLEYLEAEPSIWPVTGKITSKFGYRKNPMGGGTEFHEGLDIGARNGSPVVATAKGTVAFVGWVPGYGRLVRISHNYGFETAYGHNSSILVKTGQKVEKGEIIARVGSTGRSTGPHVHYEIIYKGKRIDPSSYLP